jgi:hypothetical protein
MKLMRSKLLSPASFAIKGPCRASDCVQLGDGIDGSKRDNAGLRSRIMKKPPFCPSATIIFAVFFVCSALQNPVHATTIDAAAAGFVRDLDINGTPDGANPGGFMDVIKTDEWAANPGHKLAEDRAIAEFDLSSTSGPVISATLTIPVTQVFDFTKTHNFGIYSYAGDGAVTTGDFALGSKFATFTIDTSTTSLVFDVTTLINGELAANDHYVGFRIDWEDAIDPNTYQYVNFAAGTFAVATLSFDLAPSTTPLPAALPMFASGLGALGLLGWRRKKRSAALTS